MKRAETVLFDSAAGLAVPEQEPVVALCCLRCGGTRRALRRVDRPVKGYVCTLCLGATGGAVVWAGKKDRVLVGPMADELAVKGAKK